MVKATNDATPAQGYVSIYSLGAPNQIVRMSNVGVEVDRKILQSSILHAFEEDQGSISLESMHTAAAHSQGTQQQCHHRQKVRRGNFPANSIADKGWAKKV